MTREGHAPRNKDLGRGTQTQMRQTTGEAQMPDMATTLYLQEVSRAGRTREEEEEEEFLTAPAPRKLGWVL